MQARFRCFSPSSIPPRRRRYGRLAARPPADPSDRPRWRGHRRRSSREVELSTTSAIGPPAWLLPLRPLCRYSTMSSTLHDFSPLRAALSSRGANQPSTAPPPKASAAPVGAEHVLRRMARAAMRHALDQIAAAIPFRALLLVGLEDAGPEEQPIPDRASPRGSSAASAIRGGGVRVANRRQRREIGADRQDVLRG